MTSIASRRSPLSFVVLALLVEQPMHAYGLHKLMRERRQDALVNIERRNSVQQVLDRLQRDGFIEVVPQTGATTRRRIVHRVTEDGDRLLHDWLRTTIAEPRPEFPSFPVAISLAAFLDPTTLAELLEGRRTRVRHTIEREQQTLAAAAPALPAILLLENDLGLAQLHAELEWLERTVERLRSGELDWDRDALVAASRAGEHLES